MHVEPGTRTLSIIRRDRADRDDAILELELDRNDSRPDPEWVQITRGYEANFLDDMHMTLAEFRWIVQRGADLLAASEDAATDPQPTAPAAAES
jgi:hypothetical protein